MRFIFSLILFCQTTLALIYNDKCTQKCDFPGMVCVNNRCKCDSKIRLFWTNARCASCPNDWAMTETACVTYYETVMSWERAKLTCQNVKAELISFRNRDIISLIYSATNKNQLSKSDDKLSAWTSAHTTDLTELGLYQWLDPSVNSFNNKSDWWCKKTTSNLGYKYDYDEPTRYTDINSNETEACVVYWRGKTDTEIVCLDDQFCSQEFAFVCEKSEFTANQYLGPPPVVNNLSNASTNADRSIIITFYHAPKSEKQPTGIIIIIIMTGILFVLALLCGLYFFLKRRNATKTQFNINRSSRVASANDTTMKDELIHPHADIDEDELVLENGAVSENIDVNIDSQKNRRAGYSKQQFDEFE